MIRVCQTQQLLKVYLFLPESGHWQDSVHLQRRHLIEIQQPYATVCHALLANHIRSMPSRVSPQTANAVSSDKAQPMKSLPFPFNISLCGAAVSLKIEFITPCVACMPNSSFDLSRELVSFHSCIAAITPANQKIAGLIERSQPRSCMIPFPGYLHSP